MCRNIAPKENEMINVVGAALEGENPSVTFPKGSGFQTQVATIAWQVSQQK